MKKLLLSLLLLVVVWSVNAQNQQDVIYLKDGSILRGVIIEQVPMKMYKLQTAGDNIMVIAAENVEKVTREAPKGSGYTKTTNEQSGYSGIVEVGANVGLGDYGFDNFRLNFINGYRFDQQLFLGFGLGLRAMPPTDNTMLMPMFLNFRADLGKSRVTPFAAASVGYTFDLKNSEGLGMLFNGTFGVKYRFNDKMGINLGLNIDFQSLEFIFYNYGEYYIDRKLSPSLGAVLGFSF